MGKIEFVKADIGYCYQKKFVNITSQKFWNFSFCKIYPPDIRTYVL